MILLACVKSLGWYIARIYEGKTPGLSHLFAPLERLTYRYCGVDPSLEMTWQQYSSAVLLLSLVSFIAVYSLQRL